MLGQKNGKKSSAMVLLNLTPFGESLFLKKFFMIFRTVLILCLALTLSTSFSIAQNEQLKAFYTFNIIRYVGWPEGMKKGNFIISVVNDKEVAQHLRAQTAGRKFGFQEIEVREYSRIEDAEHCQVLYLGSGVNTKSISSVLLDKFIASGTLVITDSNGAAPYGSSVNFVTRDNSLFFELHSKNANRAGLQFSSRLAAMSTAINL